jgi:predicted ATP-grasp superfamily ATP-dependent carboligase
VNQREESLLLLGASTRAAAFSALRAGLRPWCADLFADADLQSRCPVVMVRGRYPQGLADACRAAPPGPWMYTGALENHPGFVDRLSRQRRLWGNAGNILRPLRDPLAVVAVLRSHDIPCPRVCRETPSNSAARWLVKPLAGAGGRGIRFWDGAAPARGTYFQENIEGEATAAVYIADGQRAHLVGVTCQLVGVGWLHAGAFHYCGSIGPLVLDADLTRAFERLGAALARGFHLRGLIGVDCVVRDNVPYPVEVNPRYTASMEVLEYGLGLPLLGLHRQAFQSNAPAAPVAPPVPGFVGKAILFAAQPLVFPAEGPWTIALQQGAGPWDLPAFADVPVPGTRTERGRPVLSFFARATSVTSCLEALRATAADLTNRFTTKDTR